MFLPIDKIDNKTTIQVLFFFCIGNWGGLQWHYNPHSPILYNPSPYHMLQNTIKNVLKYIIN